MIDIFVILLIFLLIFLIIYILIFNSNCNFDKFESECWIYGDNYNDCYSNSNCTIGFLPNGSTQCMKKFLQEDI